jgi:hypothetical protein
VILKITTEKKENGSKLFKFLAEVLHSLLPFSTLLGVYTLYSPTEHLALACMNKKHPERE